MFERSEFLSAHQTSAGRREPAQRARRWGAFSCLLLSGKEKKEGGVGGATPGI